MIRYIVLRTYRYGTVLVHCRFLSKPTHYTVLNIKPDASQKEVKTAFIKMSKKFHPDLNKNNSGIPDDFLCIKNAYDVLYDKQKREKYNREIGVEISPKYDNDRVPDETDFDVKKREEEYWKRLRQMRPTQYIPAAISCAAFFGFLYGFISFLNHIVNKRNESFFEKNIVELEEVLSSNPQNLSKIEKKILMSYKEYKEKNPEEARKILITKLGEKRPDPIFR